MNPLPDAVRLLDPRGQPPTVRLSLAPRPDGLALAAGGVLFYDNTKMDVGSYGLIFPRLKAGLQSRGIARFHDYRETIRGKSDSDIKALAKKFRDFPVAGAIIGLADMGICPAMVALTIALEAAGIPTVCLTAGPGSKLAVAYAHYRAGALCLVPFDIYQATGAHAVTALADACVDRVQAMLTRNGGALAALARIDYAVDDEAVAADGLVPPADCADGEEFDRVYACFERLHIGDGLPCVPPTVSRYEAMRAYCPFDPSAVILWDIGPSGAAATVRDALVAALMAGCTPEFVPIVLAALRAIAKPQYGLSQAVTTSFAGGHFVLASGPLAAEAGMHGGQGCLGPGFRANATIGRAINLLLLNVCRAVPGHADLACLSSPAEYSYCMAEDAALTSWLPMNVEQYDKSATCVMVMKAESPHSVLDLVSGSAAHLLETIIDCCTTLGSNNAYLPGSLVVVLNPDHARVLVAGGYDKQRLRVEIHDGARVATARLAGRGLGGISPREPAAAYQRVTRGPEDVIIVVGGGKGGHSAIILPWALHSDPVFEAVRLPDGNFAKTLAEFRAAQS